MVKIVATRCHILKLKCPEFDFVWGSAPDPAAGPLDFMGPAYKRRKGEIGQGLGMGMGGK